MGARNICLKQTHASARLQPNIGFTLRRGRVSTVRVAGTVSGQGGQRFSYCPPWI